MSPSHIVSHSIQHICTINNWMMQAYWTVLSSPLDISWAPAVASVGGWVNVSVIWRLDAIDHVPWIMGHSLFLILNMGIPIRTRCYSQFTVWSSTDASCHENPILAANDWVVDRPRRCGARWCSWPAGDVSIWKSRLAMFGVIGRMLASTNIINCFSAYRN